MEPEELTDGSVLLRCWDASDADAVFAACQDPVLQRWTRVPVPYLREHATGFVADAAARWAAGVPSFGIFDPADGTLLGAHGFVGTPELDVYEVGYWVAATGRGRGVATAATRLVCRFAFERMDAVRVEWQAEVGNVASRQVAEKVGFVLEGTLRRRLPSRGGTHVDGWIGGLLPGEISPAHSSD